MAYILVSMTHHRFLNKSNSYTLLQALAYLQYANVETSIITDEGRAFSAFETEDLDAFYRNAFADAPSFPRGMTFADKVETLVQYVRDVMPRTAVDERALAAQAARIAPTDGKPYAFNPNGADASRLRDWYLPSSPAWNGRRHVIPTQDQLARWGNPEWIINEGVRVDSHNVPSWLPSESSDDPTPQTTNEEHAMAAAKKTPAKKTAKTAAKKSAPAKKTNATKSAPAAKKAPAKKTPAATPIATPPEPTTGKRGRRRTEYVIQNGVKRPPNPNGACGQVWGIADEISKKNKRPAEPAEVIEACVARGLNAGNARTEVQKWRRFHGLAKKRGEK